jgi:hypothetical protein
MIGGRISEVRLNGQDQEKSLNVPCTKGGCLAMAEMQAVALGRSRISQDSRAPVRVTFKPREFQLWTLLRDRLSRRPKCLQDLDGMGVGCQPCPAPTPSPLQLSYHPAG